MADRKQVDLGGVEVVIVAAALVTYRKSIERASVREVSPEVKAIRERQLAQVDGILARVRA